MSMNDPESLAVNAPGSGEGRAEPEVDRQSAAAAREVMEGLYPTERTRGLFRDFLLDCITHADSLGSSCWSITLFPRVIRLNTGPVRAVNLVPGAAEIHVPANALTNEIRERLGARVTTASYRGTVADGLDVTVVADDAAVLLPLVLDPAKAYIEHATGHGSRRTPYSGPHSDGVLAYLEHEAGREVPRPSYRSGHTDEAELGLESLEFPSLRAAFEEFLKDPVSAYFARLRRTRGEQIRELFRAGALRREDAFNREVWRLESQSIVRGEERTGIAELEKLTPAMAVELTQALADGEVELHGNYSWGSATHVYAPSIADPDRKAQALQRAEEVLLDPELGPSERYQALKALPGFGRNTASGLVMLFDPTRFAIFNSAAERALSRLGLRARDALEYQRIATRLREQLGAEDFHELDLFLYLVGRGRYWQGLLGPVPEASHLGIAPETRYWKIAPGASGGDWERCRTEGSIGVGWNELGDLRGVDKAEFDVRLRECLARFPDWKRSGALQVWKLAMKVRPGDRIVANRGTTEVLGLGTVTSDYYYDASARHAHRVRVRWDDDRARFVSEPGWRRTLIELAREDFERVARTLATGEAIVADGPDETVLGPRFFALLDDLRRNPSLDAYLARRTEFAEALIAPFQRMFRQVVAQSTPPMLEVLETEKSLFSKIPKNDFGRGEVWPFYWGAIYPKGTRRAGGVQLFVSARSVGLSFGFSIGTGRPEVEHPFIDRCRAYHAAFAETLEISFEGEAFRFGSLDTYDPQRRQPTWREWLRDPSVLGPNVHVALRPQEVMATGGAQLVQRIATVFQRLFPLVLIALREDPVDALETHQDRVADALSADEEEGDDENQAEYATPNKVVSLSELAEVTSFQESDLTRWLRAIERKRQAILYGPPGTGKTFLAERLARYLIGGGDGFVETVQFHPAYAYEDFVQGLRPKPRDGGGLDYQVVPGRFLDFCERARRRDGISVLILDEINRANLSRVFGELMYLLEYREKVIPLAAGGPPFSIPAQVRIVGTMNTADRSIALVDHALRRRFAFIEVRPDLDALQRFHERAEAPPDITGLVEVLRELNDAIGDRHYHVGISFFLRERILEEIEDIWLMEIEPYLDEIFDARPRDLDRFQWNRVRTRILQ